MKKTLLAAIIAATALVPPAALAQDRGGRGGQRSEASQGQRGGGNWRQSWNGQSSQAQPQRQWNGGQGRPQRTQSAPQAQVEAQPQVRPQYNGARDRGPGQAQQRPQYDGNRDRGPDQARQRPQYNGERNGAQWNRGDNRPAGAQQSQQWRGDRNNANRGNGGWNDNRNRGGSYNDRNRGGWNNDRGGRGGWNNDRGGRGGWNNSWRNDRRYDWRGYRSSNRGIYRLPRYYAPSGWGYGYRRFGIGFTLNSILYSSQYWINDPFYYRLPEVDGPYRWVRYYNDAILVDIYSGEVVDTIYDIFW